MTKTHSVFLGADEAATRGYLHTDTQFHNALLSSLAVFPMETSKLGPTAVKVMLKFFPPIHNNKNSPLPNALPSITFITRKSLGTFRAKQF
jgi:hypothetical protein